MRLGSIVWLVVGVVILSGGIAWRMGVKMAADAELAKGQAARKGSSPRVVLTTAKVEDLIQTVDVVGTVESPYVVKLSPKVGGRIAFLQAREGDVVKPGDTLVRIDPSELKGQVLQQQAAVAEAQSRLAQAKLGQNSTEVSIGAGISQQQAGLSSASADLNQVQKSYESQVAGAKSVVADAAARVQAARSAVEGAQADQSSAQANLENAQSKFERTQSLFKQGFIAAQDVDDARTALRVQEGALAVAKNKVASAQSAHLSASAQLDSAKSQAKIVAEKGQADIAASKARLNQSKASLTVAKSNRSQSPAYQESLAALASSVRVAQAQLAQAQAKLNDTTLTSSIEGVVTAREADEGSMASSGQPILTVQYLKWLFVTASVPIEQSAKVTVGTPVHLSIDALPGEQIDATITEVNPSADPQSRQFTVRVRLDNAKGQLKPGMYARLGIETGKTPNAVVLPRDAVKTTDEGSTVILLDSELKATTTPVTIGASDANRVQILTGVKAGDKVVLLAYQPVKDGQKVREGDTAGGKKREGKK